MRHLPLIVASISLLACSSSAGPLAGEPDAAGDATFDAGLDATVDAEDAGDAGVGCLFCADVTEDLSAFVRVRDAVDQICSKSDGCHGSGAGQMGMAPGNEFASMIGVTAVESPPMLRVAPGDPAQSYVFLKLACEGGVVDACMPFGVADPLLAQAFHDWIEAGAPTQ